MTEIEPSSEARNSEHPIPTADFDSEMELVHELEEELDLPPEKSREVVKIVRQKVEISSPLPPPALLAQYSEDERILLLKMIEEEAADRRQHRKDMVRLEETHLAQNDKKLDLAKADRSILKEKVHNAGAAQKRNPWFALAAVTLVLIFGYLTKDNGGVWFAGTVVVAMTALFLGASWWKQRHNKPSEESKSVTAEPEVSEED